MELPGYLICGGLTAILWLILMARAIDKSDLENTKAFCWTAFFATIAIMPFGAVIFGIGMAAS